MVIADQVATALAGARVVVTGASGFVGTHLRNDLLASRVEVWNIDRTQLRSAETLTEVLRAVRPTHIFHLAGVLPAAEGDAALQYDAHVLGTVRLLDAVLAAKLDPCLLIASSSAVYGRTKPDENPLSEDSPLQPLTHYAASKIAQETVALHYHFAYGLRTVRVRAFNLVGPGQSQTLLASSVARQIAMAEREGSSVTVRVGNLFPRRDYVDVRDAVRAYAWLAARAEGGSVYNICSGRSVSVQECLGRFERVAGVPLRVEIDTNRLRAVEISDQVGSADRLRRLTGWQPGIAFDVSLRDVLAYWRERLSAETALTCSGRR